MPILSTLPLSLLSGSWKGQKANPEPSESVEPLTNGVRANCGQWQMFGKWMGRNWYSEYSVCVASLHLICPRATFDVNFNKPKLWALSHVLLLGFIQLFSCVACLTFGPLQSLHKTTLRDCMGHISYMYYKHSSLYLFYLTFCYGNFGRKLQGKIIQKKKTFRKRRCS